MKEQRNFTRVPFETEILVNIAGERYRGRTGNLSLYGLFVHMDEQPEVQTEVEVTIPLLDTPDERYIGVTGVVARRASDGIGIKFRQLDVDTFIELKNIVSVGSGSETKIMEEFFKYITYKDTATA